MGQHAVNLHRLESRTETRTNSRTKTKEHVFILSATAETTPNITDLIALEVWMLLVRACACLRGVCVCKYIRLAQAAIEKEHRFRACVNQLRMHCSVNQLRMHCSGHAFRCGAVSIAWQGNTSQKFGSGVQKYNGRAFTMTSCVAVQESMADLGERIGVEFKPTYSVDRKYLGLEK